MFSRIRTSNIIKRTFSHHRDLIKIPTSCFVDTKKIEETNKNVHELVSKIDQMNHKIHQMNHKIININNELDYTQFFIILNFVITTGIGIPILFITLT